MPDKPPVDHICADKTFREIFFRLGDRIRNFLYYKTGDLSQAEDLTQEAFSRLWENCRKVAPDKAKSYLFTIARNLFLNQVAHRKVVLKYREQQAEIDRNDEDPASLLEQDEFRQRLEEAIQSLPEGQRVAFLLNRLDGLTYPEIAALLGISVKAVEKRIHKALVALRKIHNAE